MLRRKTDSTTIYRRIIARLNREEWSRDFLRRCMRRHFRSRFTRGKRNRRAKTDLFTRLRLIGRSLTKIWVRRCLEFLNRARATRRRKKRSSMANRNLVPEVVAGGQPRCICMHTPGTEVGAVSRRLKEGRQGFRAYLPLATAVGHSQVALFFTFKRYVTSRNEPRSKSGIPGGAYLRDERDRTKQTA